MSATKAHPIKPRFRQRFNQKGVASVEFAFVALLFFTVVFGIIEFARAMYMYNTMAEVTRSAAHAAANISFNDADALNLARKRAVLDEESGNLPFGSPITYRNVRIDYLYLPANGLALQRISPGSMPSCPARNRVNCMNDPNSASCIRAVQARICQEGASAGTCTAVSYQPLISLVSLRLKLPIALTIASAESLGYRAGDIPCP
ncbi:TadE/TadG family type IV pilus assembly protein [Massilia sp. 9096]|uniref:TadE/TadG family type IV pilus assembly protein n=1 Tax=Massilia sp. 9096 TaxID=1500894 RepID=UPI00056A85EA|nr:TadE/TadG family type IV pilus assembly protein [Massilia sp. 9096]